MIKFSAEVRRLAKRANQRMVEMESHGFKSPAYKAVQARLEMMGRRSNTATGRRFSETGKGTENELRQQLAELQRFLGHETSTIKGYRKYRKDVYEGADKKYKLKEAGITQEEFEELWDAVPDKEKDRFHYAMFYYQIVETYELKVKKGEIKDKKGNTITQENAMSITEIMRIVEGSKSLKSALQQIGITTKDMKENIPHLFPNNNIIL